MSAGRDAEDHDPEDAGAEIARETVDARRSVIAVRGELDLANALDLEWSIEQALIEGSDCVVLDLAATTFIDAPALGAIADACRRIAGRPGALHVAGLTPELRRVFRLTALDRLVPVYATAAEALAGCA